LNINGNKKEIEGTVYLDSWIINRSILRGNWDWGVTRADKYVLIHFKSYQGNSIKDNETLYLVWKDNDLIIGDQPHLEFIDFNEKEGFLKINYKNSRFEVQQKIDVRKTFFPCINALFFLSNELGNF